jgi:hypothetical protein
VSTTDVVQWAGAVAAFLAALGALYQVIVRPIAKTITAMVDLIDAVHDNTVAVTTLTGRVDTLEHVAETLKEGQQTILGHLPVDGLDLHGRRRTTG